MGASWRWPACWLLLAVTAGSAQVTGRVLDSEGRPLAGARVTRVDASYVSGSFAAPRFSLSAPIATDADGRFRFAEPASPPGETSFLVEAEPFAFAFVNAARRELTIRLSPATTLEVPFTLADGTPAKDLPVRLLNLQVPLNAGVLSEQPLPPGVARLTAITDAQGIAHFAGLPRETGFVLDVDDPRYARLGWADARRTSAEAASRAEALVLAPAATVTGRVVDRGTGLELGGLPVRWSTGRESVDAVTDGQGRFRLERLRAGLGRVTIELTADQRRLAVGVPRTVTLGEGERLADQDVELVPGVELVVRLETTDGRPLERGSVSVSPFTGPLTGTSSFNDPVGPDSAVHWRVLPGRYAVSASALFPGESQARRAARQEVEVRAGQAARVVCRPGDEPQPTVRVRVVDAAGAPVSDAEVWVEGTSPDRIVSATARTGPDGRVSITVEPGLKLTARAHAGPRSSGEAQVVQPGTDVLLRLGAAAAGRLQVRVVDEHGRPLPGAEVTVALERPHGFFDTREGTRTTDAEGRVTFTELAPGEPYRVSAQSADHGRAGAPVTLKPGEQAEVGPLQLPRADEAVAGWVFDPAGKPIPGATVSASDRLGTHRRTLTNANGEFRLSGLAKGRVQVTCQATPWLLMQQVDAGDDNVVLRPKDPPAKP